MFVTSKSTLFTTFLISILVFLNKPSSANRKFVFFVALRRNFIYKRLQNKGIIAMSLFLIYMVIIVRLNR